MMQRSEMIRRVAGNLRHSARKMGCAPTREAVVARFGEDAFGEWTIEALSSVPAVRAMFHEALTTGDDDRYCALERFILDPALERAARVARDTPRAECDECRGTGWYTGFRKRERCSRGCPE